MPATAITIVIYAACGAQYLVHSSTCAIGVSFDVRRSGVPVERLRSVRPERDYGPKAQYRALRAPLTSPPFDLPVTSL